MKTGDGVAWVLGIIATIGMVFYVYSMMFDYDQVCVGKIINITVTTGSYGSRWWGELEDGSIVSVHHTAKCGDARYIKKAKLPKWVKR